MELRLFSCRVAASYDLAFRLENGCIVRVTTVAALSAVVAPVGRSGHYSLSSTGLG